MKPGYFGPPHLRKCHEEQIPVPVGSYCIYCGEGFVEGDMGSVDAGGSAMHYECLMRAVIGSVGHQNRKCPCYGGTEEDPPGLSRRDAARAAVALWAVKHAVFPKLPTKGGTIQDLHDDLAALDRILGPAKVIPRDQAIAAAQKLEGKYGGVFKKLAEDEAGVKDDRESEDHTCA